MLIFDLEPLMLGFLVLVMVFSGLVHGTLGLGFPMVATPIIAIFLDVRSAILITLLPTVAVNLVTIYSGDPIVPLLRRFGILVLCSLLGGLAGTWLLATVDPNPFRLVLAVLILIFLGSTYLGRLPRQWLERHEWIAMVCFGTLAGLSAGTTNVMVAVLLIYFLSLELPRNQMLPILNMCFLIGKVAQIFVFSATGMVGWVSTLQGVPLAIAGVGALLLGQRVRHRIPTGVYRRVLEGLLVMLAGILLYQFLETAWPG